MSDYKSILKGIVPPEMMKDLEGVSDEELNELIQNVGGMFNMAPVGSKDNTALDNLYKELGTVAWLSGGRDSGWYDAIGSVRDRIKELMK